VVNIRLTFYKFGVGRHFGKLDASINLGLISGYKNLFADEVTTGKISGTWKGVEYKDISYTNVEKNENSYRHIMPKWRQHRE